MKATNIAIPDYVLVDSLQLEHDVADGLRKVVAKAWNGNCSGLHAINEFLRFRWGITYKQQRDLFVRWRIVTDAAEFEELMQELESWERRMSL
tara:strand:- start:636 stop:914 length:279 start_codon:yes stop_codon:yes gene_type:complete